jgi:hypothetical protein
MRPVIPHKSARSGPADGKWLAGMFGFICLVALGVWIWGLLNLPTLPAILLWWWPSLLAGALAGAAACVALEAARFIIRVRRNLRARARRKAFPALAGAPEPVSAPLASTSLSAADLTPAE